MGEVRTVFKTELDRQVTQEARAERDNKIHLQQADARSQNGDAAAAEDEDEEQEGGDKVR